MYKTKENEKQQPPWCKNSVDKRKPTKSEKPKPQVPSVSMAFALPKKLEG